MEDMNANCGPSELNILWIQGRCEGMPSFIDENTITLTCGSFGKFCSISEYKEVIFEGPSNAMCIGCDSELGLIALANNACDIYILRYPGVEVITGWKTGDVTNFKQLSFTGEDYLLTLGGSPITHQLAIWRWRDGQHLKSILWRSFSDSSCFFTLYPESKTIAAVQENECLHFFNIEDNSKDANLRMSTMYTPVVEDSVGTSLLTDADVERLTFYDKMSHESWGLHSELLHKMPLRVLFPDATDREIVKLYDILCDAQRIRISCHCWLPDKQLIAAGNNGTIFIITLPTFSIKMVKFVNADADENVSVSCMAFNKNGLFYATKRGEVFTVQTIDEWLPVLKCCLDELPVEMKFSPNYKSIIFFNDNNSIQLYKPHTDELDYVESCTDDSRIVGIFFEPPYCTAARQNGLVETWMLESGAPAFAYDFHENIVCMEGVPCCSMFILSSVSSQVYVIEFANATGFRIIATAKPSETPIQFIKPDPYCRLAVLVSSDPYVFIYSILPSNGFKILGYFKATHDVKDVAIFSKAIEETTFVFLLGCNDQGISCITKFELPADILDKPNAYYEDSSGIFSNELLKVLKFVLKSDCSSIVIHHSIGLMLCLPTTKEIIRIPYEAFKSPTVEAAEICCHMNENGQKFQILLSTNQKRLLVKDDKGSISVRKTDNFDVVARRSFYVPRNSLQSIAVFKDMVFVEGYNSELICSKVPDAGGEVTFPWDMYLQQNMKHENEVLLKMVYHWKHETTSWIQEMMLSANKGAILEFSQKKEDFENQLHELERRLKTMVEENLLVPKEHQIGSEEFVFDEEVKEGMIKCREEQVKIHTQELEEKLRQCQANVCDICKECIDTMLIKGRRIKSLKDGPVLQNYSIPIWTETDMEKIQYSYKKLCLESCLKKKNGALSNEKAFKELNFQASIEDDCAEYVFDQLKKQPFQLQSTEERIDYVHLLKYVIFKKRLQFNHLFDNLVEQKKDVIAKIRAINTRVKEIICLTGEDKVIWEPTEDDDLLFHVTDEEVEDACKQMSNAKSENRKSLAEGILKEEWLLKRKTLSMAKYQMKLKRDHVERLKKEAERKFKEIDQVVDIYQKQHTKLIEEKTLCDLDINQIELQISLLLFSVANFRNFRKWESLVKTQITKLENASKAYNEPIRMLNIRISNLKGDIENVMNDILDIDYEVLQISKMSRNKQAFLEAYDQRPKSEADSMSLNPYKMEEIFHSFDDMNTIKNKPQKVPLALWKQLCILREQKFKLEGNIKEKSRQIHTHKMDRNILRKAQESALKETSDKQLYLQDIHEMRIRCKYETPMVLSIADTQLEIEYPDDLDFTKTLFLRKFHAESLNCLLNNAGSKTLGTVQEISKALFQIEKNEACVRKNKLKIRDTKKEIEIANCIPLTKDVQKIMQDPQGFRLQDKLDAMEKSKKLEMEEYERQIEQVNKRISSIEVKKDILRRSLKEKKKEIEKLKGDIAELKRIEKVRYLP